jgi:hypothetical protein
MLILINKDNAIVEMDMHFHHPRDVHVLKQIFNVRLAEFYIVMEFVIVQKPFTTQTDIVLYVIKIGVFLSHSV